MVRDTHSAIPARSIVLMAITTSGSENEIDPGVRDLTASSAVCCRHCMTGSRPTTRRSRSCSVTMPTRAPASSTTGSPAMWCSTISCAASRIDTSGRIDMTLPRHDIPRSHAALWSHVPRSCRAFVDPRQRIRLYHSVSPGSSSTTTADFWPIKSSMARTAAWWSGRASRPGMKRAPSSIRSSSSVSPFSSAATRRRNSFSRLRIAMPGSIGPQYCSAADWPLCSSG
jgi:hypothetical protein